MKLTALVLCASLIFIAGTLKAQRVIIGEKAPEIKVKTWVNDKKPSFEKLRILHFIDVSTDKTEAMLQSIAKMAEKYKGNTEVVIVIREMTDYVKNYAAKSKFLFFLGVDDEGKTYGLYNIKFLPYSIVVDVKGRVLWTGSPYTLHDSVLEKFMK